MKAKNNKPAKISIGGQAVMEGVMMRGESAIATCVRDLDGNIQIESKRLNKSTRPKIFKFPIIRGVVSFFESMVTGTAILMRSAEVFGDEQPSKFEKWLSKKFKINLMSVAMTISLLIGIALSIFLFVFLPQFFTAKIIKTKGIAFNFVEGGLRIAVFLIYIIAVSLLKDIRRVFMYHGAEHKTINCFESGNELTVQNAKNCSRLHNRCGTTFLFFVMLISIIIYSVANISASFLLRFLSKIALLPLIAGLSYELLKALAKTDSKLLFPLKAPGLLLQRLTTKEPDDEMLEVAITAFNKVIELQQDDSAKESSFFIKQSVKNALKETHEKLEAAEIYESSEAEWLVSKSAGIKRSELEKEIYLTQSQAKDLKQWTEKRIKGEPLWYVLGDTDFYGYTIKTDSRALIPRPETEELTQKALEIINSSDSVLDLCCGSGAIAIAVNKISKASVVASDISQDAIDLAAQNANLNQAQITFIKSDLFESIVGKFSVIISNPPYIKSADIESLQTEVKDFEPLIALDGGDDGLLYYRRICADAHKYLYDDGCLFLECGESQAQEIKQLLKKFSQVEIFKDIFGKERIIKAIL